MKFDVVASLPHYLDHMIPIWECLPADMRGDVHPLRFPVQPPRRNRMALVAGWQDVQALRPHHRMIYVEHGAGQTYAGDPKTAGQPGYSASGGWRHGGVEAFICPNDEVASRWKTAPSIAVGCPKMDQYVGMTPIAKNTVCFAWHWESRISPEARSAITHYASHLADIVTLFQMQGFTVYGHAHPRWEGQLDRILNEAGMTVLATDREVFLNADILFVDNSSIGMEFMSLGRPVVWMNAPWYRRDVHHGGRFWDWTVDVDTVDHPHELLAANLWDIVHGHDQIVAAQRRHVDATYAYTDGSSGQRAADFIAERFGGQ